MTALDARQIRVAFGGVVACDEIDLEVRAGEVVGLTGPNGSGKSTLLNALTGLVPASGHLRLGDEDVPLGLPRTIRAHGVVRAFQTPQNWFALSVLDNVTLGSHDRAHTGLRSALFGRGRMRRHEAQRWEAAADALDRVGLRHAAAASASTLTYGQQRMLEVARAIAARPAVMLLDEPSAGLNATETRSLSALLAELQADGVSMVVVDHKVDFLDSLSDRIVVLELGRVVADAPPDDVWSQQAVIDAYLGTGGDDW